MLAPFLAIGGTLLGIWAFVKYLLLIDIRIPNMVFKTIYDKRKEFRCIIAHEEMVGEGSFPAIFSAFAFPKKQPMFHIHVSERVLNTGFESKESLTTITCFRWRWKKLRQFLLSLHIPDTKIPVEILMPRWSDRIGWLKSEPLEPLVPKSQWSDISDEIDEVFQGKRDKTGAILYGPPGNGKSSFIKYIAAKHKVPIKVITFSPEYTNHHILSLFSNISEKSIVIFEDFDNYFVGKDCKMQKGCNFTFDILLNCLDGVYHSYEQTVFFMTVNDIEAVDDTLKNRPSRFKFVRKFDNPPKDVRNQLLPQEWADASEGFNLDQILRLKEYNLLGKSLTESLKTLNKEAISVEIEMHKKAYYRFLERSINCVEGTDLDDWDFAKNGKVSENLEPKP